MLTIHASKPVPNSFFFWSSISTIIGKGLTTDVNQYSTVSFGHTELESVTQMLELETEEIYPFHLWLRWGYYHTLSLWEWQEEAKAET